MELYKLKCSMCSELLVDPCLLPCDNLVCSCHMEIIYKTENFSFLCHVCEKIHSEHDMYEKKGRYKKTGLVAEFQLKLDLLSVMKEANKTVQKIENGPRKPELCIYEYCEDLKHQVDLRRETLRMEIDKYSDELMKFIGSVQSENMELAKSMDPTNLDESLIYELKKTIKKYEACNKGDIKKEDFKEVCKEILKNKFLGDKMLEESQKSVLKEIHRLRFKEVDIPNTFGRFEKLKISKKFDSKIVPFFQYKLVNLCNFEREKKWKLIYRATRDGFSADDFHSRCDGIEKTLTLVKASTGNIFGGYAEEAWDSDNTWVDDSESFIFSLCNNEIDSFKAEISGRSKPAIGCIPSIGPRFGNDICIASNSNVNEESYSNFGHSYHACPLIIRNNRYKPGTKKARSLLAGSYHFMTSEIEVFAKI